MSHQSQAPDMIWTYIRTLGLPSVHPTIGLVFGPNRSGVTQWHANARWSDTILSESKLAKLAKLGVTEIGLYSAGRFLGDWQIIALQRAYRADRALRAMPRSLAFRIVAHLLDRPGTEFVPSDLTREMDASTHAVRSELIRLAFAGRVNYSTPDPRHAQAHFSIPSEVSA